MLAHEPKQQTATELITSTRSFPTALKRALSLSIERDWSEVWTNAAPPMKSTFFGIKIDSNSDSWKHHSSIRVNLDPVSNITALSFVWWKRQGFPRCLETITKYAILYNSSTFQSIIEPVNLPKKWHSTDYGHKSNELEDIHLISCDFFPKFVDSSDASDFWGCFCLFIFHFFWICCMFLLGLALSVISFSCDGSCFQ